MPKIGVYMIQGVRVWLIWLWRGEFGRSCGDGFFECDFEKKQFETVCYCVEIAGVMRRGRLAFAKTML